MTMRVKTSELWTVIQTFATGFDEFLYTREEAEAVCAEYIANKRNGHDEWRIIPLSKSISDMKSLAISD